MIERLNISDLSGEELNKVKGGGLAEVVEKRKQKPQPQAPYGQPQTVPQERKPESQKKHDKRDGRR